MIRCPLLCAVTAVCCLAAAPAFAVLPRADFHAICPFTAVPPSVFAVLDGKRWRSVLSAARTVPPPYEAGATDFRRELIVVVVLPHTSTPITQAALNAKRPQRFDPASGTLQLWYDVQQTPVRQGEVATTVVGEPCLVTWVAHRSGLRQIVARTTDGRRIASTQVGGKIPKKGPTRQDPAKQ